MTARIKIYFICCISLMIYIVNSQTPYLRNRRILLNKSVFSEYGKCEVIYPTELEVKHTTESMNSTSYLDLQLEFDIQGKLNLKLYDKRDDFNFPIPNRKFTSISEVHVFTQFCNIERPKDLQLRNTALCDYLIKNFSPYRSANADRKFPLKRDRIAIVGAGAAGVHMAYKLQDLGYKDVTIFEKTDRVGGKCHTIEHKKTRHEMGTLFAPFSEYEEVHKLLKDFEAGTVIPSDATRWLTSEKYYNNDFAVRFIMQEFGIVSPLQAKALLSDALGRYIQLHKSMFSDYPFELFPRPNATILEMTKGSFWNFLQTHNMTTMKAVFILSHILQGYGQLEDVSALYGLIWNTPGLIILLTTNPTPLGVIDNGYQRLWEVIVRKRNLRVIYNANITRITRKRKTIITYDIEDEECPYLRTKSSEFEFLILAADMKELMRSSLKDLSLDEIRIFNKIQYWMYAATLIDHEYGIRGPFPSDAYYYNVLANVDLSVTGRFDAFGLLSGYNGNNYTNGLYAGNALGEFIESSVFYQFGHQSATEESLNKKFEEHAKTFNFGTNYKIIYRKMWPYFPRYSQEDMTSGILWDILDMQGYRRTWYIGSSVSFESVRSVLEYNNLLIHKFLLPTK